jgi:Dynamin family
VGFLGASGAGKSSLINTLLDHEDLLPADDEKACTASVIEISFNPNDGYEATVVPISIRDWQKELKDLFQDLEAQAANKDGDDQEQDFERDLRIKTAFQKIKCVYPDIKTIEDLLSHTPDILIQHQNVKDILGQEKEIHSTSSVEFSAGIKPYVASGTSKGARGQNYAQWPLVKLVRLRIPSELLRHGLVLVDLPGSFDSNVARGAIAEDYQKNLTVSCIVAPATRAATDKPVSGSRCPNQCLVLISSGTRLGR